MLLETVSHPSDLHHIISNIPNTEFVACRLSWLRETRGSYVHVPSSFAHSRSIFESCHHTTCDSKKSGRASPCSSVEVLDPSDSQNNESEQGEPQRFKPSHLQHLRQSVRCGMIMKMEFETPPTSRLANRLYSAAQAHEPHATEVN